jgi:homoserine kinase
MSWLSVRVPASAANLGPGYDAFGLALGLHNVFHARFADAWQVEIEGEGARALSTGADNQVASAMARVFAHVGSPDRSAHIVCENAIPTGRGLGSSASAIIGGVVLADALLDAGLGRERLLEIACEIEGHPDNVAAALLGGFVIGWRADGGACTATSIEPHGGLAAVLAIPEWELPTSQARAMLPAHVPHADAAFSAGRAGLLAVGIALGRADLIGSGLADRLHQPYRVSAVPDFDEVSDALVREGALGAVLSGAGPTIVGLVHATDDTEALQRATRIASEGQRTLGARARRRMVALPVDRGGARLL